MTCSVWEENVVCPSVPGFPHHFLWLLVDARVCSFQLTSSPFHSSRPLSPKQAPLKSPSVKSSPSWQKKEMISQRSRCRRTFLQREDPRALRRLRLQSRPRKSRRSSSSSSPLRSSNNKKIRVTGTGTRSSNIRNRFSQVCRGCECYWDAILVDTVC